MPGPPVQEHEFGQIKKWLEAQKPRSAEMKNSPKFLSNLEATLDERRARHNLFTLLNFKDMVDFSSNDFLSLATSGMLREAFLEELRCHPDFAVGSTGSRVSDGNSDYVESVERQIAAFHGAETAFLVNSGYDGNCAIFSAIPRPGDAIVFDELIHASVHDGMKASLATTQVSFKHNDAESLRETLNKLKDSQPLIQKGARCVLVAVEAVYSMDGDVTPLIEIVEIIKDLFPMGNGQIIIDEAHSTGLVGKNGRGMVCALGLEKDIAVRLHTYGKGLGTTGAAILASSTVRSMLVNFARPIIYTTAPSFPTVAAIRAGYNLLESGKTQKLQDRVEHLVKHFSKTIEANPVWNDAVDAGICSIPTIENLESRPFVTQFLPVWTRQGRNFLLWVHLQADGFCAFPVDPPVVPRGTGRVRITIHAANTEEDVEGLATSICNWAREMLDMQAGSNQVPSALRRLYGTAQAVSLPQLDLSKIAVNPFY